MPSFNKSIGGLKPKLIKQLSETEMVKECFLKIFKNELEARKAEYFKAKEKKDEVFQELEHLKASSRLLETRLKKKLESKSGVSYPLKLGIGISNADLNQNKSSILGNQLESNLKIYYKVDNGKDSFTSSKVSPVLNPEWPDEYEIQLHDPKDRLYFEIMMSTYDDDSTQKTIDNFDISASIIEQNLKIDQELTDNILTSMSNQFNLTISNKVTVNPKLQNYRNKIIKNEALFSQVEPPYLEARGKFEKFLNLKGLELVEEWGICGNDIKANFRPKTGIASKLDRHEEEKHIELNMDLNDRSFLGSTIKRRKTLKVPKKDPKKTIKHSFTKKLPADKFEKLGTVVQVTLEDIGDVNDQDNELKGSESEEMLNQKFENLDLKEPDKASAVIEESKEISKSPENIESHKEIPKNLTPSQQLLKDEKSDLVNELPMMPRLTSDLLRANNMGSRLSGLGSSLINFAMQDMPHTNQVKTVYNQNTTGGLKIGGMMKSMDINDTLSGMLMMNNNNNNIGQSRDYNIEDDNCSLISGNTFQTMQNIGMNPMNFGRRPF